MHVHSAEELTQSLLQAKQVPGTELEPPSPTTLPEVAEEIKDLKQLLTCPKSTMKRWSLYKSDLGGISKTHLQEETEPHTGPSITWPTSDVTLPI